MTLIDPTGGVGYAFGQILPSSHMTTVMTQQPNAIDGINGSSHTLNSDLAINTNTVNINHLKH